MILHEQVEEGINSRCKMLSINFNIPYEDLYQEGMLTVLEVTGKNKKASLERIMKAINNKYSNIMRKAINHKAVFSPTDFETIEEVYMSDPWEKEDRRIMIKKIGDKLLKEKDPYLYTVFSMSKSGYSIPEIAKCLDLSNRDVAIYRDKIKQIMRG